MDDLYRHLKNEYDYQPVIFLNGSASMRVQLQHHLQLRVLAIQALVLSILLVSFGSGYAYADERRVALVLANSSYIRLGRLANPQNDLELISSSLEASGFNVTRGSNLKLDQTIATINKFIDDARTADVSLFYYAGHAFQLGDRNYLVPIDANLRQLQDVPDQTFDIQRLMKGLAAATGIHLVFLDACRDNPFGANSNIKLQDGLAKTDSISNLLLAYATQPGNVARDGDGRNSPFARALAEHSHTQGEDINTTMIRVRIDVIKATGGAQIPWDASSLTQQFYFYPGPLRVTHIDTEVWQFARSVEDPDVIQAYIDHYPGSPHVDEARKELRKLAINLVAPSDGQHLVRTSALMSEDKLWNLVQTTRIKALAEAYIKRFPSGSHIDEATSYLDSSRYQETAGEKCERAATHPRDATGTVDGVPLDVLADHVEAAIAFCTEAVSQYPAFPKYKALLARAQWIVDKQKAISLYREAAAAGNLRAMVSLGLLMENGDNLPKDVPAALKFYEQAADLGSADGAINLAVDLIEGRGISKNYDRGIKLLRQAMDMGSGIAAYDLGAIATACYDQRQLANGRKIRRDASVAAEDRKCEYALTRPAFDYFADAIRFGFRRGYLASAILLDEGRGVAKDPRRAAELLTSGASQDEGEVVEEFATSKSGRWSPDTITALQKRLTDLRYFSGSIDGRVTPQLAKALSELRSFGE